MNAYQPLIDHVASHDDAAARAALVRSERRALRERMKRVDTVAIVAAALLAGLVAQLVVSIGAACGLWEPVVVRFGDRAHLAMLLVSAGSITVLGGVAWAEQRSTIAAATERLADLDSVRRDAMD